ncbi:MAG: hypothetical protein DSZ28_05950 [Thiothrix sp.]|nr:MAG: hypothetical protein DSZ28_05950 [Thiothrix sp.]
MPLTKYSKGFLLFGILAVNANQSLFAEALNVFEATSSHEDAIDEIQSGNVAGRVKYNLNIKNSITEQSGLILNLDFLNESVVLDVVSVNTGDSSYAYSAISPNGKDILTVAESNGVMSGSLTHNDTLYQFKPVANGDTLIIETDDFPFVEQIQNSEPLAASNNEWFEGARAARLGGPDDGSKIDIIIAYTPEFVVEEGEANIAAFLAQLEQETNLSFQLSGVNTRVEIVHSYPTPYNDSTNAKRDADYFLNGLEAGQELRELRDQHHADIMVVLTGSHGYDACGYTPMLGANEANALAVIRGDCATGYYQFAHELGHIFGADHNIEEASGLGADYAHGYCGNGWRSIMSYNCPASGGKRLPLWSNPDKKLDGEPMGVTGVSNNVKVLNERALEVSNFRFPVAVPEQVTLTSPLGIIVTDTSPDYTWEPAERSENYTLKVTDKNGNVLIEQPYSSNDANCASGTCSVTPVVELPFDLINWWITAENTTGKGAESEKGIFTVAPIPIVPGAATLTSPAGVISSPSPTYKWNAVAIASWYKLLVEDGSGTIVVNQWYKAVDANCQSGEGECSVTPTAAMTQNPVKWSVQTWNSAGYGGWSESKVFQVFPLP